MNGTLAPPWDWVVLVIETLLFGYFLAINAYYVLTASVALANLPLFMKLHRVDPLRRSYSSLDVPVTAIIPAYNEQEVIVKTVRSLLAMEYPLFEIIVINDGSIDGTHSVLNDAFGLEPHPETYRRSFPTADIRQTYRSPEYPFLRVIDKANGGKADALNAGLNFARYPLVLACDADSYYHPTTLQWMTEPFQKDKRTVVVGGSIAIGNDCIPQSSNARFDPKLPRQMLLRFQALEYLRAFLTYRMGWAPFNAVGIVSGACGLWRKDILIEAGGYRLDTVWEDMEMTLRVHHMLRLAKRPYRVAFTPYPVCWTMAPETIGLLYHQRILWQRHIGECMSIHRRLFGSGGVMGWFAFPYLVLFEWLAPLVVLFGVLFTIAGVAFRFLDLYPQLILVGLVIVLAVLISFLAILLDELSFSPYRSRDMWSLFSAAIVENVGYRQLLWLAGLTGLLFWALRVPIRGRRPPGIFVAAYPAKTRAAPS